MSIFKTAVACTLSGALIASLIGPAAAGPMPTNVAAMKSMVTDGPTQVHWRGGGWGIGAGLLAGALIGGAIASSTYGYYGAPYYYGSPYPYYGYGYYPPRVVYYGGPYYGGSYYGYYRPYRVYRYRYYRPYW